MRIRRKRRYQAVEPDEILIDAQNLPGFDENRMEGKIERPIEARAFHSFLVLVSIIGIVFVGQLFKLQVVDASSLKARAEANRLAENVIIADRGAILDRNGEPLALNDPQDNLGFSKRTYPLGEAAAQLVGYVNYPKRDQNGYWFQETIEGRAGVERSLQTRLAGENGAEIKETNATGETVSGSTIHVPKKGEDIALSIDAKLQQELYDAIKERTENASFVGGSGVIIDVTTGEIYAIASYPSFDPTVVSDGEDSKTIGSYVTNESAPFLDRAISGLYTPGSVVKPFVAVAALEKNIISPEKQLLSTGSISVPNPYDPAHPSVFRDWKAHGWVNLRQAIAVSSDVYFYVVGGGISSDASSQVGGHGDLPGLGIAAIDDYMARFGFGETAGIDLPSEEAGIVPSPDWKASTFDGERWFLGNTYHTAIGQYGFQVTVLQLARAVAALANGGTLVTPSLEKGVIGPKTEVGVHDTNLEVVREGMHLAVNPGNTAAALNISGVSVAGKTGTAEVGVHKEFINSSVEGFFPYENPRFAFAIVMERAKAGTTAGAPLVMRNVLEWIKAERPEMLQ